MAESVKVSVVIALYFAVLPGRDHSLHSKPFCQIHYFLAVIASVRYQAASLYAFDKAASLSAISFGTRCNNNSDRHAIRIHGQMYL